MTGAPDAAQELNLGADTAKFLNVPLDVIYKYYFRAKRSVTVMPISQRLCCLQTRDVEERSEWVSKFRESTMSLGQVICEVYTSRDAHWSAPGPTTPDKKTAAPTAASPVSPTKVPPSTSPLKLGKPINGKQVATAMKDGTKLCPQYQRSGCKAKPCPQGAIVLQQSLGRTGFVGPSTMAPQTAPTSVDKPRKRRRLPLLGWMG